MIVIALLCVPFIFYFSKSNPSAVGRNSVGNLYGEPVSTPEFQRSARLFTLARELGMFTFLQDMIAGATSENEAATQFAWNHLILRHEAERLGIQPGTQQIAAVVKELRPFRGEKGFDLKKYNDFTQNALPSLGFSDAQVEELAGDQLTLERIKELLGVGVQISDSEGKENYERAYGKMNVSVVRLRSEDLSKEITISDDDVAKYFEAHKAELNTEEKRKVNLVSFALSDEQKKLVGKERVEVLQKLADKANDFNQALLEKGAQFDQAAAKFQLPVQTTGAFTRSGADPLFQGNAQLSAAAFQLTTQEPNSDAVQVGDGFYVLHLDGTEPARPLTLDEAKPKIMEAIKSERLQQMVSTKGAEIAQKIRDAMKPGVPVETALQQARVTVEKVPPFSLADSGTPKPEPDKPPQPPAPDLRAIKGAVAEMRPGEVSNVVATEGGGFVAVLEKREPPETGAYEAGKMMFDARYLSGKREVTFYEWLRERRREAGVQSTTG
ncbi:MAG: peptidyl-prolyl cis-trans isomerase [Verrucomicrobiota bacterium]|nr:peptidyl-prolyl cis-trans isomerase [Verrucomicrobiota bacterium]